MSLSTRPFLLTATFVALIIIITTLVRSEQTARRPVWKHKTCYHALASLHLNPDFDGRQYPLGRVGDETSSPLLVRHMIKKALNYSNNIKDQETQRKASAGSSSSSVPLLRADEVNALLCDALVLIGGLTRSDSDNTYRPLHEQIERNRVELVLLNKILTEEIRMMKQQLINEYPHHFVRVDDGDDNNSSSSSSSSVESFIAPKIQLPSPIIVVGFRDWAGLLDVSDESSNRDQLLTIFNALSPHIPEKQKEIFISTGCYSIESPKSQMKLTFISLFTMPFMKKDYVVSTRNANSGLLAGNGDTAANNNHAGVIKNHLAEKILQWLDEELQRITDNGHYAFLIGERPFGMHAFTSPSATSLTENYQPQELWDSKYAKAFKSVLDKYSGSTILGMNFATGLSSHVNFLNVPTSSSSTYGETNLQEEEETMVMMMNNNISDTSSSFVVHELPPALSVGGTTPRDNFPMLHKIEVDLCKDGVTGWEQMSLNLEEFNNQKKQDQQEMIASNNLPFHSQNFLEHFVPAGQNLTISSVASAVNELLYRSQHNNFVRFLGDSKGGIDIDPTTVSYLQQRRRLCAFITSMDTFTKCAEICSSKLTLSMFLRVKGGSSDATANSFADDESRVVSKVLQKLKKKVGTTIQQGNSKSKNNASVVVNAAAAQEQDTDDDDMDLSQFWPPFFLAANDMLWSVIRLAVSIVFLLYCVYDAFVSHPALRKDLIKRVLLIIKFVTTQQKKNEQEDGSLNSENILANIEPELFKFHYDYQNILRRGAWFRLYESEYFEGKNRHHQELLRWTVNIAAAHALRQKMERIAIAESSDIHHPFGGRVEKCARSSLEICKLVEKEICCLNDDEEDDDDGQDEAPQLESMKSILERTKPSAAATNENDDDDNNKNNNNIETKPASSSTVPQKLSSKNFHQKRPPPTEIFPIQHSVFTSLRELHKIRPSARTKTQELQLEATENWLEKTHELAKDFSWAKLEEFVHLHYMAHLFPMMLFPKVKELMNEESENKTNDDSHSSSAEINRTALIKHLSATVSSHIRVSDLDPSENPTQKFIPSSISSSLGGCWVPFSWFTSWLTVHIIVTIAIILYLQIVLFEGFQFWGCYNRTIPTFSILINVLVDCVVLFSGSKPPFVSAALFANAWAEVTNLPNNALASTTQILLIYFSAFVNLILFFSCYSYSRHRTREAANRTKLDLSGAIFLAIFSAGVGVALADQFASIINAVMDTIQRDIAPAAALSLPYQIFFVVFLSITNNSLQYAVELDSQALDRGWVKTIYPFAGFAVTFLIAGFPSIYLGLFMLLWTLVIVIFLAPHSTSTLFLSLFGSNTNNQKITDDNKTSTNNKDESTATSSSSSIVSSINRLQKNPIFVSSSSSRGNGAKFSGSFEMDFHGLFSPKFLSPSIQITFHGLYLFLVLSAVTPDLSQIGLFTMVLLSHFGSFTKEGFIPMLQWIIVSRKLDRGNSENSEEENKNMGYDEEFDVIPDENIAAAVDAAF